MATPVQPSNGPSSWLNISNSLQTIAQNIVQAVLGLGRLVPTSTSGQLAADTLVQTGFVRLIGVSVVAAGTPGTLRDAVTLGASSSANDVYELPSTAGYYPVQMIFANGLVYKAGSGETIALFYSRT